MAIYIKSSNTNPDAFMPYKRYPDVMIVNTSGGRKAPTITKCVTDSGTHDVHVPDYMYFIATGTQRVKYTDNEANSLQYSYDKVTWNVMNTDTYYDCVQPIYIKAGSYRRLSNALIRFYFESSVNDGPVTVGGNIASLYDGCGSLEWENPTNNNNKYWWNNTDKDQNYIRMSNMFLNATALIDASLLVFPWKKIDRLDMSAMFKGCTNLVNPPTFLLEEIRYMDMTEMFNGDTLLENMPDITAVATERAILKATFASCTSLTNVPNTFLDETSIVQTFQQMFQNCSGLETVDDDFLTRFGVLVVPDNYYLNMFSDCTSLLKAPALTYTSIGNSAMSNMFYNCTSLTDASRVRIKGNVHNTSGYASMFASNLSMIALPTFETEISIQDGKTQFENQAYYHMFYRCKALEDASSVAINVTSPVGKSTFEDFMSQCDALLLGPNKLIIDVDETNVSDPYKAFYQMFMWDKAMTTIGQNGFSIHSNNAKTWGFMQGLFYEDVELTSAPTSVLLEGSTGKSSSTYAYLFYMCRKMLLNLNNVQINVTDLGKEGCAGMFLQCYVATGEIAELPCMDLEEACYRDLFNDCWHIDRLLPILPATKGYPDCYKNMFFQVGDPSHGGQRALEIEVYLEEGENCAENMFAHYQAVTDFTFKVPDGNPYGWHNAAAHGTWNYYDKELPLGFTISEEL